MSSIFSSSTRGRNSRSKSESRTNGNQRSETDKNREPIVDFTLAKDVATLVCIELSRAILIRPDVNIGTYVRTVANSRSNISLSDASVLISVAVLEHIGNYRMAQKLIRKSSTLERFYFKLGLNDSTIREMFVTMIFALSPEFVKMVDKAISLVIDRSTAKVEAPYADQQMVNALVSLENSGMITGGEMVKVAYMDEREVMDTKTRRPRVLTAAAPRVTILPDDSISQIGDYSNTISRAPNNEREIHEYLRRKKMGAAKLFSQEFKESRPPVSIHIRQPRQGLGYKEKAENSDYLKSAMNNLLGSRTLASYNLATGDEMYRRPKVEDYVESESISNTALRVPTDVNSFMTQNYLPVKPTRNEPTESIPMLDESVSSPYIHANSSIVDSAALLKDKLADMDI
jgi:hypothetical protein